MDDIYTDLIIAANNHPLGSDDYGPAGTAEQGTVSIWGHTLTIHDTDGIRCKTCEEEWVMPKIFEKTNGFRQVVYQLMIMADVKHSSCVSMDIQDIIDKGGGVGQTVPDTVTPPIANPNNIYWSDNNPQYHDKIPKHNVKIQSNNGTVVERGGKLYEKTPSGWVNLQNGDKLTNTDMERIFSQQVDRSSNSRDGSSSAGTKINNSSSNTDNNSDDKDLSSREKLASKLCERRL